MATRALNDPAEIPAELDRWNWGAFLLNWIWGIGNSTFIALLCFIPLVNLVMVFVLGARGSRWAWRNRAWRDAEHFRSTQRGWAIAGFIVWGLAALLVAGVAVGLPRIMKGSEAYAMTMQAVRSDERVKAALGDDVRDAYWISGHVEIEAEGTGRASFVIPVHGSRGEGTVVSRAVRNGDVWDIRLLVVRVEGGAAIVLANKDGMMVPDASTGI